MFINISNNTVRSKYLKNIIKIFNIWNKFNFTLNWLDQAFLLSLEYNDIIAYIINITTLKLA